MTIKLKRAYEPVAAGDGHRVLIDRLWPRGMKKAALKLDEWAKELSPSTELRKTFGHDPGRWKEFRTKFRSELRAPAAREKLEDLAGIARRGTLTLVYSAKDERHNDAVVLKQVLEKSLGDKPAQRRRTSPKVVGVDHLSISVSDFKASKEFYGRVLGFLGFKVLDEYEDAIGWTNGKTRVWISKADRKGRKHKYRFGDVGFHHYAFRLSSRKDVDELQRLLERMGAKIADPAGKYYENYYGVYFEDPDGLEFEGMWCGEIAKAG
jgi:uncharacterized protein YeaO (DUF488 family)/catechol 2,3-dioxygenase-like lactoylglutathione lyase family enzyme